MKITVENPNDFVEKAWFEVNNLSLSLFINTTERWLEYDSEGADGENVMFFYYPQDDLTMPDIVKLTAESQEEKKMISRLHFNLHSKNQLWILFPHEKVYECQQ